MELGWNLDILAVQDNAHQALESVDVNGAGKVVEVARWVEWELAGNS